MGGTSSKNNTLLAQAETDLTWLLDEARGLSQRSLERVRLLKELFPDELVRTALDYLEQLDAEVPRDRRHAPRFADMSAPIHISPSEAQEEGVLAAVRDRSATGLCLRLDWPAAVGSFLWMRATDAEPEVGWVPLEVRHCRPDTRGWLVGCRFVHNDGGIG
jgi:hypothetical protein